MAAATDAYECYYRQGDEKDYLMDVSVKIYKGTMVFIKNTTGYAVPNPSAGDYFFAGIAKHTVDNSSGSAAATEIKVKKVGIGRYYLSGAAITDIGVAVYSSDNTTVTKTSGGHTRIGTIVGFPEAGMVDVIITGHC